jgi:Fe-S-cluster-containing hydrogenase component 2
MPVIDEEKKAVQKCTLCMESDRILPACVEACKDNVLKVFSVEELEKLKSDVSFAKVLEETLKMCQDKL